MPDREPAAAHTERLRAWWWLVVTGGIALLAAAAFHAGTYAMWCALVTPALTQDHLRTLLAVVLIGHVAEAVCAVRLAQQMGQRRHALAWFVQTLAVGYPSLRLLLRDARRRVDPSRPSQSGDRAARN